MNKTAAEKNAYGIEHGYLEGNGDGECQLTSKATERQDAVDNTVFELLNSLVPFGSAVFPDEREYLSGEAEPDVAWNIEDIAEVREAVQAILYKRLGYKERGVVSEDEFGMHFYPYIALEDAGDGGSTRAVAFVDLEFADPMHPRHAPELARNVLRALVGEARSGPSLVPEGAAFMEDDDDTGLADTGGYTKRITVRIGDAEVSEVP